MKVDGRCHCGGIRFRAVVDPDRVGICHCTDCQMLTGGAYRVTVPAPAATFELLSGSPTVYVKTADSGTRRAHAFCPTCGTPIYATSADGERTRYSLRIGTLTQRHELVPRVRIWCSSELRWSEDLRALPRHEKQP